MAKTRIGFLLISSLMFGAPAMPAVSADGAVAAAKTGQTQTMEARNKAAVEATLQAWMGGDGGALQSLLADDVEWTISGKSAAAGTTRGRRELMTKVLTPFGARFSQSTDRFKPRAIHGVYADGDMIVAHFLGGGTTNNGRPYENSYVWLLTMRDGKVVRGTAFFDSIAFNELWQQTPPASN
jgi:uncharacterized protein